MSELASRQSVTPEWRPQGQCPDWIRQVCKTRAPTQEQRWRNKFQKLCSCLRVLLLPPGFCRCLVSCPFCVVAFSAVPGCALFSWFPSVGGDPETEHFRRQPPSTYAVTGYAATYIGGNAGMPILLCTVQFFSAFSPSSILASAYWAFHRPSRERKPYYSLWVIRFPGSFVTSRHHVLFSTEPERSPSQLFSSASPYRLSRHGCCGSST